MFGKIILIFFFFFQRLFSDSLVLFLSLVSSCSSFRSSLLLLVVLIFFFFSSYLVIISVFFFSFLLLSCSSRTWTRFMKQPTPWSTNMLPTSSSTKQHMITIPPLSLSISSFLLFSLSSSPLSCFFSQLLFGGPLLVKL